MSFRAARRPPGLTTPERAALALMAIALPLLLVPLPRSLETPVARYALDFTHAPLFAALFLGVLWLASARGRRPRALAALGCLVAGGLVELLQHFTVREASLRDFALDALGVALAWTGISCWRRGGLWRAAHTAVVVASVSVAVLLVARKAVERRALAAMMPLLAGFEHPWELDRWNSKAGTRMRRSSPGHAGSGWALEVHCSATETWPGVSMEDFESDWRGYRWLEWSVRVPSGGPLELAVRIDDDQGAAHGTRYTTYVPIYPSREVYRIDLREVAAHFRQYPMNMARVTELHFFLDEPRTDRTFSIDEVRLVGQ